MKKYINNFKEAKWWILAFDIWTLISVLVYTFPHLRELVRLQLEWVFFLQGIILLPSFLAIVVIESIFVFLDLGLNIPLEWISWIILILLSLVIGAIEGYIAFYIAQLIKKLVQNKKAKMEIRRNLS